MRVVTSIVLLAAAFVVQGSNVLVFSTNSAPVPGRALVYLLSVNTPEYATRADVLINPVLPNHPLQWCKVTNGAVFAMSTAESNAVVSALAAAAVAARQADELAAKVAATNALVNFFTSPQGRAMFAGWEATLDQFNVVRTNPTAVLPALTLTQLTNAIKTRISAQVNSQ